MIAKFIKKYHNVNSLYINQQNKWLWLRIHKTAGTSMYDGFLKDHCINISKKNHHQEVKNWIQHITDKELKNYTIWTCVRNPYDRYVSMAAMFNKEPNEFALLFHQLQKTNSVIFRHSQPQHIYTHKNGVQIPQIIVRFEHLQSDFSNLCKTLNLPDHELQKLNATKRKPWQEVLTTKTIQFINKEFNEDFKAYHYKQI